MEFFRRYPLVVPAILVMLLALVFSEPSSRNYEYNTSVVSRMRTTTREFRDDLVSHLHSYGLTDESLAIVSAMTLGEKSLLTRDVRKDFSSSGASHVLALSGLHLSILYFLLSFLLPFRRYRWFSSAVSLSLIWSYAVLVGLSVSIVRSAVMLSVFVFARLLNRPSLSLNSLALAAIVIVLPSPSAIYEISFQLSFLAVLAIITIYPVLYRIIPSEFLMSHRILRVFWSFLIISFVAQLGTAPLSSHYFGTFPTYFLLTNLIVIPASYIIVWGGLFMFLHIFPVTIGAILSFTVSAVRCTLSFITSFPGAVIDIRLTTAQVAVVYLTAVSVGLVIYYLKQRSEQTE